MMDNKLNEEQINKYSEQIANKLLSSFFDGKEKISGEEILNFSAIKQVNLFTLKGLFETWKEESQKLESSYFDYNDPEVLEAIENFKNIVSRHILVDEISIRPILLKAITESLILIFSPYHFYFNELNSLKQKNTAPYEGLKELKKFTKVNTAILEGMMTKFESGDEKDSIEILDDIVENLSSGPEEMDGYIEAFSNYATLDINDIYLEVESSETYPESKVESSTIVKKDDFSSQFAIEEEKTLNESLAPGNQTSLADMHEQQKIESLSKGISLNQRFMFVNVLFDGDVAKFNNTVLEMDGLVSLQEAKHYMDTHFGQWDPTSYEAEEFMSILERRFL